jgi:hypothetical protein
MIEKEVYGSYYRYVPANAWRNENELLEKPVS